MNRWTRAFLAFFLSAVLLVSPLTALAEIAPEVEVVTTTQEPTAEAPQAEDTPSPETQAPEVKAPEAEASGKDAPKKATALSFRKDEVEITLQQYAKGIDYRDLNTLMPTPKDAKAEALLFSVRDKKDGKPDSSVAAFVDYDKNGDKLEGDYAESDIAEIHFEVYAAGAAYVRAALKSDPGIYAEFKLIVRDDAQEQAEVADPADAPDADEGELETEDLPPEGAPEADEGELETEDLLPVEPAPEAGEGELETEDLLPVEPAPEAGEGDAEEILVPDAAAGLLQFADLSAYEQTGSEYGNGIAIVENNADPYYAGEGMSAYIQYDAEVLFLGDPEVVIEGTALRYESTSESSDFMAVEPGEATVTVSRTDVSGLEHRASATFAVLPLPAETISIAPATAILDIGESLALTAKLDTRVRESDLTVIWQSSNPDVATVENGIVTAVAQGSAQIYAQFKDWNNVSKSSSSKIVVGSATVALTAEEGAIAVAIGETLKLNAITDPADLAIIWSSEPADKVSIEADGTVTGLIAGDVAITATIEDTEISASIDLSVITPAAAAIEISGATFADNRAILHSGNSLELAATVLPAASADELTWTYDEMPGVRVEQDGAALTIEAEADEDGMLIAEPDAEFTFTAKAGAISESRTIVLRQAATKIGITGEGIADGTLTLYSNDSAQLGLEVLPATADTDVVWESGNNPNVAEVDQSGLLRAKSAGTTTITARSKANGDVAGTLDVIVRDRAEYITLDITYNELDLRGKDENVEYEITAEIYPETATEVYWRSSNADVATVTETGKVATVTAKGHGYAVIYAHTSLTDDDAPMAISLLKVTQRATGLSVHTDPFPRLSGYPDLAIAAGQTITLGVTIEPAEAVGIGYTITAANPSLLSISGNKIKGLKTGKTTITISVADEESKVEPKILNIQVVAKGKGVTAFKLNKTSGILFLSGNGTSSTYTLKGTSSPSKATHKFVRWYSEDPSIVSVTDKGVIRGHKLGTTTIHAMSTSGFIRSCVVRVEGQKASKMTIGSDYGSKSATLYVGQILPMKHKVDRTPYEPDDAKPVAWRSTKPSVALVNDKGEVTAVSAGTTTIYAQLDNGTYNKDGSVKGKASNGYKVTVKNNTLVESKNTLKISAANVGTMYVEGKYYLDYEMALNGTLDDQTITELAAKKGVELEGFEHVHYKPKNSNLDTDYKVLAYNKTNTTIRWLSANTKYAKIGLDTGLLEAVKATPAKGLEIRGKSRLNSNNKLRATEVIHIQGSAAPNSVALFDVDGGEENPQEIEIKYSASPIAERQLRAVYEDDDLSLKSDWASSNPQVASVDKNGLVRAVGIGTAVISVSPKGHNVAASVTFNITGETNGITYRALVIGMYQTSGKTGYMPFASNSTSLARNAIARSNVDGNRYSITFANNTTITSKEKLTDKITSTFKGADENDVSIIYLHSHGTVKSGVYRWHLKNASSSSKSADFMTASELIGAVKNIPGHVILNVVSCNSGSDAGVVSKAKASDESKKNGSLSVISSTDGAYTSGWLNTASSIAVDLYSAGFSRALNGKMTVSQMFSAIKGAADALNEEYRKLYGATSISGKTTVNSYVSGKVDGITVYKS